MTTLITPACDVPGCTVAGDQYTMVRCRTCGAWVCPQHIAPEEGVTLRHYGRHAPRDLQYYQGLCVRCAPAVPSDGFLGYQPTQGDEVSLNASASAG